MRQKTGDGGEKPDLGDDGVVNNATVLVCEHAEGAAAIRNALDVSHHQTLQELHRILALPLAPTARPHFPLLT